MTPAYIAAENGHLKALKFLARLGVDLDQGSKAGITPVSAAMNKGHLQVVNFLKEWSTQQH